MEPLQFSDFEPYYEMIAHADLRMRVLGFEYARYSIAHAAASQLGMQWAREGSGQLSEGVTDRSAVGLYMQLDPRPMRVNGMALDPEAIVFFPPGSEFRFTCSHANSWFSVRVPLGLLGGLGGADLQGMHSSISVVRPEKRLAQRLRSLVTRYFQAHRAAPSLLGASPASAAFQEEVLAITRRVGFRSEDVRHESHDASTQVSRRHDEIVAIAAGAIEDSLDGSLTVAGIARAVEVSERTLLNAFRARMGMPPREFIQSMRLNHARALLRQAARPPRLVHEVAAECGYWDFGRFAAKYFRLFGEYPSETAMKAGG